MLPETLSWIITLFLIALGVIGTLLPVLPGMFLIVIAAFIHLFPEISPLRIDYFQFGVILAIFFISILAEYFFGFIGAKIGGVSRVGLIMGVFGMILGLFMGPWGIIVGPLAGVFIGEMVVARKSSAAAARATAGYAVGNLTGLAVKLGLAFVMSVYLVYALLRQPTV